MPQINPHLVKNPNADFQFGKNVSMKQSNFAGYEDSVIYQWLGIRLPGSYWNSVVHPPNCNTADTSAHCTRAL